MPSKKNKGSGSSREAQLRQQREQQNSAGAAVETPPAEGQAAPNGWDETATGPTDTEVVGEGGEPERTADVSAEDQAIKELAAELGISEDLVREEVASGNMQLVPSPLQAAADNGVVSATEEPQQQAQPETQPATQEQATEPTNADAFKEADKQATLLRDEIRARLERGVLPEVVLGDEVIRKLGHHNDQQLEQLVKAELDVLQANSQSKPTVGSWWADSLQPDGPAHQVTKLVPPLYVHSEGYGTFMPGAEYTEAEATERNAALEAKAKAGSNGVAHSNGTNGTTSAPQQPEAPKEPHPVQPALEILKGLQRVYVEGQDDYELPAREDIERALASLETFLSAPPAPAPRAPRAASSGGTSRSTAATGDKLPPMRTDKDGKALTRLWSAKVFGPYLVGAISTGTVVRDTRTNERGIEFDKVAEAKKWVDEQKPKFKAEEWAKLEEATKQCVGADGTAR